MKYQFDSESYGLLSGVSAGNIFTFIAFLVIKAELLFYKGKILVDCATLSPERMQAISDRVHQRCTSKFLSIFLYGILYNYSK